MNLVKLLQICLLHAALLLYADASEGCKTPDCLTTSSTSSSSSTRQTDYLVTPTATPVQPVAGHPKSIRNNTEAANHQSNDLKSQSNVELNKRAGVEQKPREKFGKKAILSKHQEKKSGDKSASKVKSLHSGLLNQRANQADHTSSEPASRLSSELSSQPSSQQSNQPSNDQQNVPVLPPVITNDGQQFVAKKALGEEGKKKSRARRAPRGGRISGKSGGSNVRRQGSAKDGESPDDDSGSMTAKPFFPLAILSILFLSVV